METEPLISDVKTEEDVYHSNKGSAIKLEDELETETSENPVKEEKPVLMENGTSIMEDEVSIIEDSSSDEDYIENEDCFVKLEDSAGEDPLDFNSGQEHPVCDFYPRQEYTNSLQSQSDSSETHQKRTPLLCQLCGKLFPGVTLLNDHIAFHVDSQLFKCGTCSKTFGTRQ